MTGIPSRSPTTPASRPRSGRPLAPGVSVVPDALVGHCWPAVFAAIGAAITGDGLPIVEGLLGLVHLDHAAWVVGALPTETAELFVSATASEATDTESDGSCRCR